MSGLICTGRISDRLRAFLCSGPSWFVALPLPQSIQRLASSGDARLGAGWLRLGSLGGLFFEQVVQFESCHGIASGQKGSAFFSGKHRQDQWLMEPPGEAASRLGGVLVT